MRATPCDTRDKILENEKNVKGCAHRFQGYSIQECIKCCFMLITGDTGLGV